MKIGSNPNKGRVSVSTRLYMKWKKVELGWRRWRDPVFHKARVEAMERRNPFHPKNRKK